MAENLYSFNPHDNTNEIFSIDTPPPTVSGHLHMGHVFSYCHVDFIARFQRMMGKNVFYPIGFDDNGLPTERLVEKVTGVKVGFKYSDKSKEILQNLLGKEYDGVCTKSDFIEICRKVVTDAEVEFEKLFKSIDLSVDWKYKYQSISDNSAKIAQQTFVNLFNKGLIYGKNAPVYWCTQDKTATANTEIEEKEAKGCQIEFNFTLEGGGKLLVMTTRPEMIPACRALLYNPSDERFSGLNGKFAIVPITGHKVPIIPDHDVKIDKGTGLVMCCTYGDWQDVIWAKRHNLGENIIISQDGKIVCEYAKFTKENGNEDFLKVEDARQKIIDLLDKGACLVSKKEIQHAVKCAERSGKALEIIPTHQWYVRIMPFKNILLEMSRLLEFRPQSMQIKLESWINGLSQDWCISRNRFFGIPIPGYFYNGIFHVIDNAKFLPVMSEDQIKTELERLGHDASKVEFTNQVLDTWFTSGLSPKLAGFKETMSVRPQAHEIIRTWTFVTLVQSYLNNAIVETPDNSSLDINCIQEALDLQDRDYVIIKSGNVNLKCIRPKVEHLPWKNVMLSGWCLASDKTKMSKSKGNIVTPLPLIEEYGSDSVRYWSGSSTLGADTAFNEALLKDGQRLITKLKNAAKMCLQTIQKCDISKLHSDHKTLEWVTNTTDRWVLSHLSSMLSQYKTFMQTYEYSKALAAAEEFFWNIFCDNYLELVKVRSYGIEAKLYQDIIEESNAREKIIAGQHSAAFSMHLCINVMLRCFAPFVTKSVDEIYSQFATKTSEIASLHKIGSWDGWDIAFVDNAALRHGKAFVEVLSAVRKAKSDSGMSLKTEVKKLIISPDVFDLEMSKVREIEGIEDLLCAAVVSSVNNIEIDEASKGKIVAVVLADLH